jgi:hypothetical protein
MKGDVTRQDKRMSQTPSHNKKPSNAMPNPTKEICYDMDEKNKETPRDIIKQQERN